MKNIIRSGTTASVGDNLNALMHCGEFDQRQVHDRQHRSTCFAPKSELATGLEHQQRLFPCAGGSNMLPMATRSFACSQLGGLADYPSETSKHQCKSEKHHDDDSNHLSGKCQMHSTTGAGAGADILVKSEFNEMQQSKSSPVHDVFEMTSSTFTSSSSPSVTGNGSTTTGGNTTNHFHHDTGSPPLPLMDTTNPSASHQHHHHQHQLQHHQHQCSAHSYDSSYVYGGGSSARGVGLSPRHLAGTMNTPPGSSESSGGLYHCKSFFADSTPASGSGNSSIASFYPNNQHHQSNGESCSRDDALDADKVVLAIKARKMSD